MIKCLLLSYIKILFIKNFKKKKIFMSIKFSKNKYYTIISIQILLKKL